MGIRQQIVIIISVMMVFVAIIVWLVYLELKDRWVSLTSYFKRRRESE